jgi:DNA-binding MarR family transcriptional regulator
MTSKKTKEDLMRELGDEFRISMNLNDQFDEAAASALGLNTTDLRCMDVIQRLGGVSAGELAREAGLTTGAVTSVIDRLERAGYAKRVADPNDRRRVLVELTPETEKAVWEIWGPETEEYFREWGRVPRAQLESMIEFMRKGNEIQTRHLERIRAENG